MRPIKNILMIALLAITSSGTNGLYASSACDLPQQVDRTNYTLSIKYDGYTLHGNSNDGVQLTSISGCTFDDSTSLSSICIPPSVERLCCCCFNGCKSLSTVIFESGSALSIIEQSAFSHSSLQSICIPASVEMICDRCFEDCQALQTVTFSTGSKLTRIGYGAFIDCSLLSVCLPSSVEILSSQCFFRCGKLKSFTFESSSQLKIIEACAFLGTSLANFVVTASVTDIGGCCFDSCTELATVTFEANSTPCRVADTAFHLCGCGAKIIKIIDPSNRATIIYL